MTPPAAQQPASPPNTIAPGPIAAAILARLVALNSTDPQLAALLVQYQTATGQPFAG